MTAQLPENPSFEQLRKQAKALLRAVRRGDPEAARRCRVVPRLADLDDDALPAMATLADAQHAVAKEHGEASWPKLKSRVERAQPPAKNVERFLDAIRSQRGKVARRVLKASPGIGSANVFTVCSIGDDRALAEILKRDANLAKAVHEPHGWTPLLYLSVAPFHSDRDRTAGFLRCGELLLNAGADPNSSIPWEGGEVTSRLTALYWACVSNNAALVELLLRRGADPNDGESIYHAAELNHRECLQSLLDHGGDISGRHPTFNNTPLYFLAGYAEQSEAWPTVRAGIQWLLEHGADPNVASMPVSETALHAVAQRSGADAARLLLDHGAVDKPRADGRTAYSLAVRFGNTPVADLLLERGSDTSAVAPIDVFLGACMRGDEQAARSELASRPNLLNTFTEADRAMMSNAAFGGKTESVLLMAKLGFDLTWESEWGGTPLHVASWWGRLPLVRILLSHGAPVNVRDKQFGSSPIAWAAHGSANCRKADDDYRAVVEALLDAGSEREFSINRWNEPPEHMANRPVAALLKARGFAP